MPPTPPSPRQQPPPPPLDGRGLPVGYTVKDGLEVSPREARHLLSLPQADPARPLLVDCRRDDEWALCRIDGAVHIPMERVLERSDELEGEESDRARPIIIHCHHGVRSLRVAYALRQVGFTNARSLVGGIDLWSIDIDPGVPRY
ncbi:MAG: rhodanese-like domain-containing protein [Phycisphaerales bacterium]